MTRRQAQAEVEAAREQVQVFGMDPDHASTQLAVKAPRSGVILDIGAAPGEFSQALSASAPLCTVADITTIWARGRHLREGSRGGEIGRGGAGHAERLSRSALVRARERGLWERSIPHAHAARARRSCRMRTGASSRGCSERSAW